MMNSQKIHSIYHGKVGRKYDFSNPPFFTKWKKDAIEQSSLKEADRVLVLYCGTGLDFPHIQRKKLAKLHLDYEDLEPYELEWMETPDTVLDYRVEKMRLNKEKTAIIVNDTLTLAGIPPETFDYQLGNRSALDWIIDQYRVKTDKRSGIVSDPNQPGNPHYIIDLIGKVVKVSTETVRIVKDLPAKAW